MPSVAVLEADSWRLLLLVLPSSSSSGDVSGESMVGRRKNIVCKKGMREMEL